MDKKISVEKAKHYFERHTVDEFHMTSDHQAFFQETDADSHAKSLPDKDVHKVTRAEAEGTEPIKTDSETEKEQLKADVAKSEKKVEKLRGQIANETDEVKKVKLQKQLDTAAKVLEDQQAELASLEA